VGRNSGCLAVSFILECRTFKCNVITIVTRGKRLFQTHKSMFAHDTSTKTPIETENMNNKKKWSPSKSEEAMIQGIIEGSPDAIGVAVVRLNCGCCKLAAVDKDGEPASKIIMYRDRADSICDMCKKDNGSYTRITGQFIHWISPEPTAIKKKMIVEKVLGLKTH
jgi:hypothetical protein